MKGNLFTIIGIWIITIGIGLVVWETKVDIIEGLSLGLIVTILLIGLENAVGKRIQEPKKEYYIQW